MLDSIRIPDSTEEIGVIASPECECHKCMVLPASLQVLDDGAFAGCGKLVSVDFSSSAVSIGEGVFSDCKALANIQGADKITAINATAFDGCESLKDNPVPTA